MTVRVLNKTLNKNKRRVFNKISTFTICVWRVWIAIRYFLFEKKCFEWIIQGY